jgi:transcriptional regulator with XRE-family HTH domain
MENRDDQPRWGRLIDEARDRMGISQNEAARRAGMSGTHWRNIVKGVVGAMDSRRGVRTVMRMAQVVGVRSEQMAEAGREDVAEALQPTSAELLAEAHADMDAIEAELDRRIRRMWQASDRAQLEELLRTLRALQDK